MIEMLNNFANAVKDTFTTGFEYIQSVVDVFKALFELMISFIDFLPSPFNVMTYITATIFFAVTIWRLIKK